LQKPSTTRNNNGPFRNKSSSAKQNSINLHLRDRNKQSNLLPKEELNERIELLPGLGFSVIHQIIKGDASICG
jgi:hypothetical protein